MEPMANDEYEQITTDDDYQHLQREVHNYAVLKPTNETETKGYNQQQHHVGQSTLVPTSDEAGNSIVRQQMARSEEGKEGSKICPPPTWVRWLLAIVGLGLLSVIVTLLVVFLSGKCLIKSESNHSLESSCHYQLFRKHFMENDYKRRSPLGPEFNSSTGLTLILAGLKARTH